VHTHLLHADLYGLPAARWVGVPAVRSIHRTVGRRGYRSLERMVGPLASRTIAISEEVARFTREARVASLDRVRVVPYGIDASPFAMSDEERGLARQELGVGPDEVAVGIASRLVPGKGHTFLIDALAVAQPEAPPIRLRIAGDGPLRAELEQHARRLAPGVARFMGHVVDVSRFMAACDVLVFPTFPAFGEGFGLAALEALAAGCPVVATPVGSMPEMVVDGVTGLLVPPGDVPRLAGALVHLAGNPVLRRTLGANAARRARTDFGVEPMVDATLRIYEEVLSGHAGVAPRAPRPKTPMPGV
jgi:glycosyltransferase involved in cell wall biosynthesis